MTEIKIAHLAEEHLQELISGLEERYAEQKSSLGSIEPKAAREQARAETQAMFPGGSLPEGHVILQATADDEPLGHVWLGPHRNEPALAFIFDLLVSETARGKGLGRKLLLTAEDWARAQGFAALSLHVFGANKGAIRLYQSQGYTTTDLVMRRSL